MENNPYDDRLRKLRLLLTTFGCDALLIEDKIHLYYLTGMELSAGRLVVWQEGAILFVDSRYYEYCKNGAPVPVVLSDDTPLSKAIEQGRFPFLKTLCFDSTRTTYSEYLTLQSAFKSITLLPVEAPLKQLRAIKDSGEIASLRRAAILGSEGYDHVLTLLKEGITEAEIGIELEIFWKKRGSKGVAFDPIIAFGKNSSMPHYRAGNTRLKRGDTVLIDIGVNFNHYHSDMTRVVFWGTPDPKIVEIYDIVKEAQAAALARCKPGTLIGEVDDAARKVIGDKGYKDYFTHSLGHGVGLEIHEYPTLRNKPPTAAVPLEEGMVITIEPGIYLPEKGGVRIENTIVITAEGYEDLTNRSTSLMVMGGH